jgi:hypothetical protein
MAMFKCQILRAKMYLGRFTSYFPAARNNNGGLGAEPPASVSESNIYTTRCVTDSLTGDTNSNTLLDELETSNLARMLLVAPIARENPKKLQF